MRERERERERDEFQLITFVTKLCERAPCVCERERERKREKGIVVKGQGVIE